MAKNISLSIFFFVHISIIGVVSSQQCNDTGFSELGSGYGANRNHTLTLLPSDVRDHNGFYNSSRGEGRDQVFAMGMCINETEPTVCSDCMKVATDQLIQNCPNQTTEAFTWVPHKTICFARYSNGSFFERHDKLVMHPRYSDHNSVEIKYYFEHDIESIWNGATRAMIDIAVNKSGTFSNRDYYATDVVKVKLTDHQALYALMQCTPGLSQMDCRECLDKTVLDYGEKDFRGKNGGFIAYPSCLFRWDMYPFAGAFSPVCTKSKDSLPARIIMTFVIPFGVVITLLAAAVAVLICRRRKTHPPAEESSTRSSLQYDLKTIEAATCTFSNSNMLGKGGFGEVFKGVLQDRSEIAVKRLSKESAQGVQEFKNETRLVAKLQHRNLVTVLGFCMEGEEKILVYEFVPNKSLDHFLFEPTKQGQLDWAKRYEIIVGTAKGILYLHHDSPLKIIHRDLKASNILLDADMRPKVADFGMARILEMDQSRADTRRVVGTHGYISPEYMMHGQFSTKSDVYSFGVLVLEIISGQRNSNFHEIDGSGKSLVTHAWKHWRNGSPLELVDSELGKNYQSNEVIRCIHIALLCVQNDPEPRPSLSTIILMLTCNSIILPVPQSPAYEGFEMGLPPIKSVPVSVNDSLIDDLVPR